MKIITKISSLIVVSLFIFASCGGPDASDLDELSDALDQIDEELDNAVDEATDELESEVEDATSGDLYVDEEGGFEIDFFGVTPSVQSQMVDLGYGLGQVEMIMYMYEKSLTEVYMLAYADYPTAYFDYIDKKESLKDVADGFFGSYGTPDIVEEEEIELDGHPGRHYKASSQSYYFVYRTYYVDNRLFQVAIMKDGGYPSDDYVDKFMDSFKLVD